MATLGQRRRAGEAGKRAQNGLEGDGGVFAAFSNSYSEGRGERERERRRGKVRARLSLLREAGAEGEGCCVCLDGPLSTRPPLPSPSPAGQTQGAAYRMPGLVWQRGRAFVAGGAALNIHGVRSPLPRYVLGASPASEGERLAIPSDAACVWESRPRPRLPSRPSQPRGAHPSVLGN